MTRRPDIGWVILVPETFEPDLSGPDVRKKLLYGSWTENRNRFHGD